MPAFGEFTYNEGYYSGASSLIEVFSTDLVVFEGLSLQNTSIVTSTMLVDSAPNRDINVGNASKDDGMFFNSDYWRSKTVTLVGEIQADSALELEQLMDTIKKTLAIPKGNLDITKPNMDARRYIATLSNGDSIFSDRKAFHITFCPFEFEFFIHGGFGVPRTYTTDDTQITSSPVTHSVNNAGTIEAKPIFIIVITSASGVTKINVQNDTTSDEIEIEPSAGFSAGDVLIVDSESQSVTLNGTEEDFVGLFPKMNTGNNTFRYTITGTSWDMRSTVKFKPRYL